MFRIVEPADYSPAFAPVIYKIGSAVPSEVVTVAVSDPSGKILGRKKFSGQAEYDCNISAFLRRELDVEPFKEKVTDFYRPRGRIVSATVAAGGTVSAIRNFTCGIVPADTGKFLSDQPRENNILGHDDIDEISVISAGSYLTARIGMHRPGVESVFKVETDQFNGMATFLLNMADISDRTGGKLGEYHGVTVRIEADGKEIGRRDYSLKAACRQAVRVCWLNPYGCLDYHTFERLAGEKYLSEKHRIYTTKGGYSVTGSVLENHRTIQTGYQDVEKLRWLSGIMGSPKVWIAGRDGFFPVDVLTDTLEVDFDRPGNFTFTVRGLEKKILQHD